jgi:hypothetical protein
MARVQIEVEVEVEVETMVDSCKVHFGSTCHNNLRWFHTTATKKKTE